MAYVLSGAEVCELVGAVVSMDALFRDQSALQSFFFLILFVVFVEMAWHPFGDEVVRRGCLY